MYLNNKFLVRCTTVLASLFTVILPPVANAQPWSLGYWLGANSVPISSLDWAALTHISYVSGQVNADATLTYHCSFGPCSESQLAVEANALIGLAHSHGVKVLLGLDNISGTRWQGCATNQSTCVTNIMHLVNAFGYDGVDVDWEQSINWTQLGNLISALRAALGTKLLSAVANTGVESNWAAIQSPLDRLEVSVQDQGGNFNPYTWFNNALFSDSNNSQWSDDLEKRRLVSAGVPVGKLNLAISLYGELQTGATGPRQSVSISGNTQISYRDILNTYPGLAASAAHDSVAKAAWFSPSASSWINYNDPSSVATYVNYNKTNGTGGWFMYSLEHDYLSGQTPSHPLMNAVAAVMRSGTLPTIPSFTASPSTISSAGASTLSWTTSGATILSIDQGVGTVTGKTSAVVSPAATTTYTLTAGNSAGSVTKSVTVTVTANNSPPTISSFTANPTSIAPGSSSMASWSTSGATSLSINQGVGAVTGMTSTVVSPTITTTYTLTAINSAGSVAQSTTVTISNGPTAYWRFDNGGGATAADSSGNGHTMGLVDAPVWQSANSCTVNGCLDFNGTNQYGSSALDLSASNVITVAFWLKWTAYANDNRIALEFTPNFNTASTGFLVLPDEAVSGQFQAGVQGNAGYNQVNFPRPSAGVWHHYAFIMNKGASAATEILPYVDGQPITYSKPTSAANTNNFGTSALFAMSRNGRSLFGSGSLDELYIFSRALSAAEILTLATRSSAPNITATSPLQVGTVGLPYSQTLASSGSTPFTWTVTSGALPSGLSLNPSSGVISGAPTTAASSSFIVAATNAVGSDSQQFSLTVNPKSAALNYNVSSFSWTSATIGWGTIHKNASVLGNVLSLTGVTYTEGIGTHANSQIVYNISGACNIFQSNVGVDDEVGSLGSVNFQVFGDGVKLYDSNMMTGSSPTQKISLAVAGRQQLKLIVNDGGDGITYDHADWTNPQLTCSSIPSAAN